MQFVKCRYRNWHKRHSKPYRICESFSFKLSAVPNPSTELLDRKTLLTQQFLNSRCTTQLPLAVLGDSTTASTKQALGGDTHTEPAMGLIKKLSMLSEQQLIILSWARIGPVSSHPPQGKALKHSSTHASLAQAQWYHTGQLLLRIDTRLSLFDTKLCQTRPRTHTAPAEGLNASWQGAACKRSCMHDHCDCNCRQALYRPTAFCILGRASRNTRVSTAWGAMLQNKPSRASTAWHSATVRSTAQHDTADQVRP